MALNALSFATPWRGFSAGVSGQSGFGSVNNTFGANNLLSTLTTILLFRQLMDQSDRPTSASSPISRLSQVLAAAKEDAPETETPAPATTAAPQQSTTTSNVAPQAQPQPAAATAPVRSLQGNFDVPTTDFLKVIRAAGTANVTSYSVSAEELSAYIQRVGANSYEGQIATFMRDVTLPENNFRGRLSESFLIALASADKKIGRITRQEAEADSWDMSRGTPGYYGNRAWSLGIAALRAQGIEAGGNVNLYDRFTFIRDPETPADIVI